MDYEQLQRSTKGRILSLLQARGGMTADELARELGVTANAVRAHLLALERDGLVQPHTVRRGPRKPSFAYTLTPAGERVFPARYDLLVNALLDAIAARAGQDAAAELEQLLRSAGHHLARPHRGALAALSREERLQQVLALLQRLGGAAEAERAGGNGTSQVVWLRSTHCPFSAVVVQHPQVCLVLEALLASLFGDAIVREVCEKAPTPRCRFELSFATP
jgi:predicted ArsR family transcriptional regulator